MLSVLSDVLGNQWTFNLAFVCAIITSAGGGTWGSQENEVAVQNFQESWV